MERSGLEALVFPKRGAGLGAWRHDAAHAFRESGAGHYLAVRLSCLVLAQEGPVCYALLHEAWKHLFFPKP